MSGKSLFSEEIRIYESTIDKAIAYAKNNQKKELEQRISELKGYAKYLGADISYLIKDLRVACYGDDKTELIVETPGKIKFRKFRVPSSATVGSLKSSLEEHFKVHKGAWVIYGQINELEITKILNKNDPVNSYDIRDNPKARLYFYPEMRI
jgi:hypothetical protein